MANIVNSIRNAHNRVHLQVDNPLFNYFLIETPIFEWYVVRCDSLREQMIKRRTLKKQTRLHDQNVITIVDSTVYIIGSIPI